MGRTVQQSVAGQEAVSIMDPLRNDVTTERWEDDDNDESPAPTSFHHHQERGEGVREHVEFRQPHISVHKDEEKGVIVLKRKWFVAFKQNLLTSIILCSVTFLMDAFCLFAPLILFLAIPFNYITYYYIYMTVACYRNTTCLTITPSSIRVEHHPMKQFSQDRTVPTEHCSNFFVRQHEAGSTNGKIEYKYFVYMVMGQDVGGTIDLVLLENLCTYEEADFIKCHLCRNVKVLPIATPVNVIVVPTTSITVEE